MCGVSNSQPVTAPTVATVGATSTADSSASNISSAPTRSRSAALAAQNIMTPSTGLGIANTNKKTMLGA